MCPHCDVPAELPACLRTNKACCWSRFLYRRCTHPACRCTASWWWTARMMGRGSRTQVGDGKLVVVFRGVVLLRLQVALPHVARSLAACSKQMSCSRALCFVLVCLLGVMATRVIMLRCVAAVGHLFHNVVFDVPTLQSSLSFSLCCPSPQTCLSCHASAQTRSLLLHVGLLSSPPTA